MTEQRLKGRLNRGRIRCVAAMSLVVLLGAKHVSAHDFWLQPQRFWLASGASVPLSLFVGHGSDKQLWNADIRRIVRLTSVGPRRTVDQAKSIQQGGTGIFSFGEDGFHVVALETNAASSQLPAQRFNDYLRAEGLTSAIAFRAANNQTNLPGTETYSRRAKLLLRVGSPDRAPSAHVTRPLGLTLEIVPEQNPYTLPSTSPLPFRIVYEGHPLSGATVMLNDLRADAKPVVKVVSDANGRVAFRIPRQGQWQLNVVWTKPMPLGSNAQFDTTFSSLTFGFDPRPSR